MYWGYNTDNGKENGNYYILTGYIEVSEDFMPHMLMLFLLPSKDYDFLLKSHAELAAESGLERNRCSNVGGCQNYGPFLDPYYNTAPNI